MEQNLKLIVSLTKIELSIARLNGETISSPSLPLTRFPLAIKSENSADKDKTKSNSLPLSSRGRVKHDTLDLRSAPAGPNGDSINSDKGKTNSLNVVASIIQYPYDIDIENLNYTVDFLSKTHFFQKSKFLVINFNYNQRTSLLKGEHPHLSRQSRERGSGVLINNKDVKFLNVNFFEFISVLLLSRNSETKVYDNIIYTLNRIINSSKSEKFNHKNIRDFNSLYLKDNNDYFNVIFIFNDITWSNIKLIFKIMDINIYGGTITRRHLLSTVELGLVKFLLLLHNMYIDPSVIFKSFNELSSYNAKYDKSVINLVKNLPETLDEIDTLDIQYGNELILKLNIITNLFLQIIDVIKDLNLIEERILNLEGELKRTKERLYDLENKDIDVSHKPKKIYNCRENINKFKEEIQKLESESLDLKTKLESNGLNLYFVYSGFFDEDGYFIFSDKLKISEEIRRSR